MNRLPWCFILLFSLLLAGCGGESNADKFQRLAKARAEKRAAQSTETESDTESKKVPESKTDEANAEVKPEPTKVDVAVVESDQPKPLSAEKKKDDDDDYNPNLGRNSANANSAGNVETSDTILAFAKNGEKVAYAGANETVGIYDVGSKNLQRRIYNPSIVPSALAIGEQGNVIAVGGRAGNFKVFSLETTEGLDRFQEARVRRLDAQPARLAHEQPISAIAIDEANQLVVTGDDVGNVRLWSSVADENPLQLRGNAEVYKGILSYQNGATVFAATSSGVSYWDVQGGHTNAVTLSTQWRDEPTVMATGLDGKGLAVGNAAGRIMLWNPKADTLVEESITAHQDPIAAIGFSSGSKAMLSVSDRGEIRRWSLPIKPQTGIKMAEATPTVIPVNSADLVATFSRDSNLDLYSLSDGSAVRRHTIPRGRLIAGGTNSDGNLVGLASDDSKVYFQDESRKTISFVNFDSPVKHWNAIPDHPELFCFQSNDGQIGVGRYPHRSPEQMDGIVAQQMIVNESGTQMLVSRGTEVLLYDLPSGNLRNRSRSENGEITAIAFDQNIALIGTSRGDVSIWPFTVDRSALKVVGNKVHPNAVSNIGITRFGHLWSSDASGQTFQTSIESPTTDLEKRPTSISARGLALLGEDGVLAVDRSGKLHLAKNIVSEMGPNSFQPIDALDAKELFAGDGCVLIKNKTPDQWTILGPEARTIAEIATGKGTVIGNASVSADGAIFVDDVGTASTIRWGNLPAKSELLNTGRLNELICSNDGTIAVAIDEAGRYWKISNSNSPQELKIPVGSQLLAVTNDGKLATTTPTGGTVFDLNQIPGLSPQPLPDFFSSAITGCFDHSGEALFIRLSAGQLIEVAVASGKFRSIAETGPLRNVLQIGALATTLFVVEENGDCQLLSTSNGESIKSFDTPAMSNAVATNNSVYFVNRNGELVQVQAKDGQSQVLLAGLDTAQSLALSPDQSTAIAWDKKGIMQTIRLGSAPLSVQTAATLPLDSIAMLWHQSKGCHVVDNQGTITEVFPSEIATWNTADAKKMVNVAASGSWAVGTSNAGKLLASKFGAGIAPDTISTQWTIHDVESLESGRFVISSLDGKVATFDAASKAVANEIDTHAKLKDIYSAAPNGEVVIQTDTIPVVVDFARSSHDRVDASLADALSTGTLCPTNHAGGSWCIANSNGETILSKRLNNVDAGEGFSVARKPNGVLVFAGGLVWTSNGGLISARRENGKLHGEWKVSQSDVTRLAIAPRNRGFAAYDASGNLMLVPIESSQQEITQVKLQVGKANSKDDVSLAWSPDGQHIVVGEGRRLFVVNARSGTLDSTHALPKAMGSIAGWDRTAVLLHDVRGQVFRVQLAEISWKAKPDAAIESFFPDELGTRLVVALESGDVIKLDIATGTEVSRLRVTPTRLIAASPIPSTGSFVVLDDQSEVHLVDDDGEVALLPIKSSSSLTGVCGGYQGQHVYATTLDGDVLMWPIDKLDKPGRVIPCSLKAETVHSVSRSQLLISNPTSQELALVASDATIETLRPAGAKITGACVAADATLVAFCDNSPNVTLYSNRRGESNIFVDEADISFASVNPSGQSLAAIATTHETGSTRLLLFGVNDGEKVADVELPTLARDVIHSANGKVVAVTLRDNTVHLFKSETLESMEVVGPTAGLQTVSLTEDGSSVLMGLSEGTIKIAALSSLGKTRSSESEIASLSFHGNGKYVLSSDKGGNIALWAVEDFNHPRATLEGTDTPVLQSSVAPDGRYVAAVYQGDENLVRVWDIDQTVKAGSKIEPSLVITHQSVPTSADFTSDSRYLLVGGADGVIRAWSIDENREIAQFSGHQGSVVDIAPLADSLAFVSGGVDRSIRSWKFPTNLPAPGGQIPKGALADSTDVYDLRRPTTLKQLSETDPLEAARQALISGAKTTEIVDLMNIGEDVKDKVKSTIASVMKSEQDRRISAKELSQRRRALAKTQERLHSAEQAETLSMFADGFSNLTFVGESNFVFGMDRNFRPVKLLFSDRFLYAARPSARTPAARKRGRYRNVNEVRDIAGKKTDRQGNLLDEDGKVIKDPEAELNLDGDNGSLLSWDYRFSQLQAHAWSIDDLNVRQLLAMPGGAGVFTAPQMVVFNQDGSSRLLGNAASFAVSDQPTPAKQYVALGTAGTVRNEENILTVFDIDTLSDESAAPTSQYRSYEGVVTAMAFAHNAPYVAFCVRERAVHRLFIADTETLQLQKLEEFNHSKPWITEDGNINGSFKVDPDAARGIDAIAFSPDDSMLIAHGHYDEKLYKFSRWDFKWDGNQLASFQRSRKEHTKTDGPFFSVVGDEPIKFISRPLREHERGPNDSYSELRRTAGASPKIVVQSSRGFHVVNLNTALAERNIPYLKTHFGRPEYAFSNDGRWLCMGDDNGKAFIYDLLDGSTYGLTIDDGIEQLISDRSVARPTLVDRPAHSGPVVGVAFSDPDPGRDYPAFAATFGEENKVKVWELYPILDPDSGIRSRNWVPQIKREIYRDNDDKRSRRR
ncbi:WD domain, G-beta repeat [Rubripirellula amarantea]|uniref:WD domain, G-beta repeat n=1 Tax=Rubripirellula amarantea TaxID=2527999 RepID=A0A5C5WSE7_9BACT|nr:WD40 repeat domain-containing protein [Rubripirellula amarantea]TWT52702.1 WD domain, G-beta repeat [Rubripirellula amarantea]